MLVVRKLMATSRANSRAREMRCDMFVWVRADNDQSRRGPAGRQHELFGGRRVLAMHGVSSQVRLEALVRSAFRGRWPVEITFDDGDRSVVENALPLLLRYDLSATLFVCPGLVDSGLPFWWDIVRSASTSQLPPDLREVALSGVDPVTHLKRVADVERRQVLSSLDVDLTSLPRSVNRAELRTWLDAGMKVGNHTWDHPCLDQCTDSEQVQQVRNAHDWLVDFSGEHPTTFAYPNGDWAQAAEDELTRLGYGEAFLFDHRVGRPSQHPLRQSRLRLDSSASIARTRLIISGAHSLLMHSRDRAKCRLSRLRGDR